jgi:Ca-activated chloride channel family protein
MFQHAFWRILLIGFFLLGLASCGDSGNAPQNDSAAPQQQAKPKADPNLLTLRFLYSSEKKAWLSDITAQFNQAGHTTQAGKKINIEAVAMGSGEMVDAVLSGRDKPHLMSPASDVFVELANAEASHSASQALLPETEHLVLSPVVIAMWKPMAEALGWGEKAIGWADILAMARNKEGWKAYDYPQWGRFKFGHTHPEYSNSGVLAMLAQVYAAADKRGGLRLADVEAPQITAYVHDIQQSIVHYGRSTGFFGRKMMSNGPGYLSAAVLYENMVIESYDRTDLAYPIVAIYPKEGTFWSDHPAGVVARDWVTPQHKEAAQLYLQYLLAKPQQEKALQYGFRPAEVSIPLAAPLDTAHGIDPNEPKTTLQIPKAKVIKAIQSMWHMQKKPANITLVLDVSGSMQGDKIRLMREGSALMLNMLGKGDTVSLLPFNQVPRWLGQNHGVGEKRTVLLEQSSKLDAGGGTALYDAIDTAYTYMANNPQADKISAIVVLSDGKDTNSQLALDALLQKLQFDSETKPTRVFAIGYGDGADMAILNKIADATQGKAYKSSTTDIREVFKEISIFF